MRERGATVQRYVLNGEQKFPERLSHVRILAPCGKQKVDPENHEIGRHDPQGAPHVKSAQIHVFIARELCQELAAYQIAAKNKKKVYADPTPAMDAIRQWKTHDTGVVNDDDDNCQGPKKIEPGLPLSVPKPRIEITLRRCR